jgi:hypothetical protein
MISVTFIDRQTLVHLALYARTVHLAFDTRSKLVRTSGVSPMLLFETHAHVEARSLFGLHLLLESEVLVDHLALLDLDVVEIVLL